MGVTIIQVFGFGEEADDDSPVVVIAPKKQEKKEEKIQKIPRLFPTPQLEIIK